MKKIYLTFDYELFFNKSGSINNSLINPTDKLLESFSRYDIKGIFFIDILYFLALLNYPELKKDAILFEQQVQRLVKEGHRVELHLHPHWLDAVFQEGKWIFKSYEHYSIHSYSQHRIKEIFSIGLEALYKIIHDVDPKYQINSYRAGGWCIEPFSNLLSSFLEHNISIDSSVAYGLKSKNNIHKFDYSFIPKSEYYFISNTVMKEDIKGPILEIPISTYKVNVLNKIGEKIRRQMRDSDFIKFGDGTGIKLHVENKWSKVKRFFKNEYYMFSLESVSNELIIKRLNKHIKKKNIIFISHPKNLNNNSFEIIKEMHKHKYKFGTCLSEIKDTII